jgi:putative ABC transport system permease protein
MFNFLLTIISVFTTALKRLRANAGLALCALIALIAAVALSVSIPVYAEGASLRLLKSELERQEQQTNRSPFALLFRYIGSWNTPVEWERIQPADQFIVGPGLNSLDLPLEGLARHTRTQQLQLFWPPSANAQNQFIKNITLGFLDGMDDRYRIIDGAPPQVSSSTQVAVEVMVLRELADEIGLNVGDTFSVVTNSGGQVGSIPIRIAAIWEPLNANDPAWFFPPSSFKDVALMPEASFTGPVAGALRNEVDQIVWFARLNGDNLTVQQASPLLGRINAVNSRLAGAIQGLRLEQSPAEALTRYRSSANQLTFQLFVFSAPILGLVFYFVALVASLLVARQRGEIALLKTRGVRDSQILGVYLVEWSIMGALALVLGPLLGLAFAQFMGNTRSFLQLADTSAQEGIQLSLTATNLSYGIAAVILGMVAALIPAALATRRTLVDEQQQAARAVRKPLWQRFYLDFLLLIPPAYGIYQLDRTGGMQVSLGGNSLQGANPLDNPLLLVVPMLFCFALGLIAVRIIPMVLEFLAWLAAKPNWIAPLIALRSLARQPGSYRGPLLLLILTLSLASFSASMAATLDGSLYQAITYQVGASTQLIETGQGRQQQQQGNDQPRPPVDIRDEARWIFVPVTDHLNVEGITAATRIGSYDATLQIAGGNTSAQLIGIDRSDYPNVVKTFRPEWADGQSLGHLMNLLAINPDGVIVSRNVLDKGLKIGDLLPSTLSLYGDQRQARFRIVAAVDLWPGFYPQDGALVIGNLNYIFDQMGGQYPYDVWIERDIESEALEIVNGVRQQGISVVDYYDAASMIQNEQMQPRRQGLFGLLSVGFIASGILTLLGFLIAALISARRRAIDLGVLRAMGMSGIQVVVELTIEQTLLVIAGIGAGTGIGLLAAKLVVPLLQVGAGPHPGTPAFPPQIAWDQVLIIYAVFAIALFITLFALSFTLGRMKLFQAVKLGDAN